MTLLTRRDFQRLTTGSARFALLLAPQFALSCAALLSFHRLAYLPLDLGWLHLPLVTAVNAAFFLACTPLARLGGTTSARIYALLLWAKGIAINGVYFCSAATAFFWGDNLTMGNLAAARQHLTGLELAFGAVVPVALGAAIVVAIGYAAMLQLAAHRLLGQLRGAVAADDPSQSPAARFAPGLVTAVLALLAAGGLWLQVYLHDQLRRDPLFSFWLRIDQQTASAADPVADAKTRQNYPENAVFPRKNVIVFTVDCLRADHLPIYGYARDTTPFLRDLWQQGIATPVEYAFSVGNDSPQGIFGILASRYPERVHASMFTLYEALERQGYDTYAFLAGDHTGYGGLRKLYGRSIHHFVDGTVTKKASINDDALILRELEDLPTAGAQPVCMLFHLMSAHSVGVREPKFDGWKPSFFDPNQSLVPSITPEFAGNTYDNRLREADDYLRQIFEVLRRKGYLDRYIAVVAGDHGEGLGEHGNYGHGRDLLIEHTRIGLLFVDPERDAMHVAPFASQVDIAPTLLDRLGLPPPACWDGSSLLQLPPRTHAFVVSRRAGEWRGVITRTKSDFYSYLCFGPLNGEWHERFFDLRSDPAEHDDLGTTAPGNLLNEARHAVSTHFRMTLPPHAH